MEPTAELVNQWQEYANQVQAQLDESTACNTQWSTYAEQLQQEKSDLEAKLANSSTPVDNNAQIKQLTAEKASLQSQWSDAVNRCSNLEQQLKSCSGAVEAKRAALDQNGALQKQLAQLQTEKDTEVASLTEQVRSLQEQLSVFATQVADENNDDPSMPKDMASLRALVAELRSELQDAEAANEGWSAHAEMLKETQKQLEDQVASASSASNDGLQAEIAALKEQNQQLTNAQAVLETSHMAEKAALQEASARDREAAEKAQAALKAAHTDLQDAQLISDKDASELEQHAQANEQWMQYSKSLEAELETLRASAGKVAEERVEEKVKALETPLISDATLTQHAGETAALEERIRALQVEADQKSAETASALASLGLVNTLEVNAVSTIAEFVQALKAEEESVRAATLQLQNVIATAAEASGVDTVLSLVETLEAESAQLAKGTTAVKSFMEKVEGNGLGPVDASAATAGDSGTGDEAATAAEALRRAAELEAEVAQLTETNVQWAAHAEALTTQVQQWTEYAQALQAQLPQEQQGDVAEQAHAVDEVPSPE